MDVRRPLPNVLAAAPTEQSLTLLSSQPSMSLVDRRIKYSTVLISRGLDTELAVDRKVDRMSR